MPDSLTPAAKPDTLDVEGARALVGSFPQPTMVAAKKDIGRIDAHLRKFIEESPFLCLGTSDADGNQDVTPRGDPPGSFKVIDEKTVAIPDRPGNNRLDSLKNLTTNPKVGLIFMVPGVDETVRVNGSARLSTDPALLASMAVQGKAPKCAIVVEVREAYLHCAKAFRRSKLWDPTSHRPRESFPTLACIVRDQLGLDEQTTKAVDERTERAYRDGLWEPLKP
jgi:PPOX class probable FMN-dependent enzyme